MPLILGTNSIKDTGFNVSNSLRFDSASADRMTSPTRGTATSQKKGTFSWWMKKCKEGQHRMMGTYENGNNEFEIKIRSDDTMQFYQIAGGSNNLSYITNRVFRDPSAWMHIVFAVDTTQSSASDRVKIYINGVQETSFSSSTNSMPSGHSFHGFYQGLTMSIGVNGQGDNATPYDGYFAEFVYIDGQQLDPTSFGEFDSDSPTIWKPKDVSGLTFGNNGFYLQFKESGTSQNSSGLGADTSGNDNHFAVTNLTAESQSTDTCTNNFSTMNPLVVNTSAESSFAEGNLQVSTTDSGAFGAVSTIGVSSGKWYWEVKPTQIQNKNAIGITAAASADAINNHRPGDGAFSAGIRSSGDAKLNGSSESGSWDSFTTSDIVGVALDLDNNKLYFSKNGTFMNSGDPTSGSTGTGAISLTDPASTTDGFYFFAFGDPGAGSGTANIAQFNFGSPPYSVSSGNADAEGFGNFEYAVPSGYFALCTKNLAEYG
jgi:hypothetical protein